MARLLVSVRSAVEARAAVAAGAAIIDVKEPSRGALGRASSSAWCSVREAVPRSTPVSVALGELVEWIGTRKPSVADGAWSGIGFCKLGLSDAPPDWIERWGRLRQELACSATAFPAWVAVVYLDWEAAQAPHPDTIIEAAAQTPECRAVLFDTWRKSASTLLDGSWKPRIERVRRSGRLVALAGSLDLAAIARLSAWGPEIFAVRGAACAGGDRLASIETDRVARLVQAVGSGVETGSEHVARTVFQMSKRTP